MTALISTDRIEAMNKHQEPVPTKIITSAALASGTNPNEIRITPDRIIISLRVIKGMTNPYLFFSIGFGFLLKPITFTLLCVGKNSGL